MPAPKKTPAPKKKTPAKKKAPAKKPANPTAAYRDFMRGDGTVELLNLGDDDLLSTVRAHISTQSIALDKALSQPGYPCSRIVEVSGLEHSGKSTLLDHALAEVQREGGTAILLDPEVARDAVYTKAIGVDPSKLIIAQPEKFTLEGTFDFIGKTVDYYADNFPDHKVVIGVDSIAGLPTSEDLVRGAGERKPGDAAKVLHHAMRNIPVRLAKTNVVLILINQLYENIGTMSHDKHKEYGGKGIPYHSSLRLRLKKVGTLKRRDEVMGSMIQADMRKSRLAGTTGRKVTFGLLHGRGVDNSWSLFEVLKKTPIPGTKTNVIQSSGAWHQLTAPDGSVVKWTSGHWGLAEKLAEHPDLYPALHALYMESEHF